MDVKDMTLEQIVAEVKEIRPTLQKAFAEAGTGLDMSKVTAFGEGLDERGKSERLANMNVRLSELGERKNALEAAEAGRKRLQEMGDWLDAPEGPVPPVGAGQKRYSGLAAVSAPWLEEFTRSGQRKGRVSLPLSAKDYMDHELKTVMSTGAGFGPQSIRSGVVVGAAYQSPMMLDLVPTIQTDQAAYIFMRQTTRTPAAAETAESVQGTLATLAEAAFEWAEISETLRWIGHHVPVTDQQLKFVPGILDLLNNDMREGVRERISSQMLNGDGNAPNIEGFLDTGRDTTDVDTAGEFVADAIDKLIEETRVTGRAEPDAIVMHPRDYHGYRRATTADGIYINGNPAQIGAPGMWTLPVVLTTEIAQGSALVGAFRQYARLVVSGGIDLAISSEDGNNFRQGVNTVRAQTFATLAVLRETAFSKTNDIVVS